MSSNQQWPLIVVVVGLLGAAVLLVDGGLAPKSRASSAATLPMELPPPLQAANPKTSLTPKTPPTRMLTPKPTPQPPKHHRVALLLRGHVRRALNDPELIRFLAELYHIKPAVRAFVEHRPELPVVAPPGNGQHEGGPRHDSTVS